MTATNIPTQLLSVGTQVQVSGRQFIISDYGRTRYKMQDRAGKTFTYPFDGNPTVLPKQDASWKVALEAREFKLPTFKDGDKAEVVGAPGKGGARYNGKQGYVAKVNAKTYLFVIPGVGSLNVSHNLLKAVK